jgi:CheY-like chemotaxis protein
MIATDPNDANDLIIEDDELDGNPADTPDPNPWLILVVDDDVDVHVVTKFALSNASFQGRRLSFLHAYSGKEALAQLRDTPGVALVLLDVIMETDDAGLKVARQIRSDLHNELTRIVLRTGQPGQALEHSIIVDYDINDFWCKADLTTRKLFTTVISSLRAYASLAEAAHSRDALNAELARVGHVQDTLNAHALVVTFDAKGKIRDINPKACTVAGLRRDQLLGRDAQALDRAACSTPEAAAIRQALASEGQWSGSMAVKLFGGKTLQCTVRAFCDSEGTIEQYVAIGTAIDQA